MDEIYVVHDRIEDIGPEKCPVPQRDWRNLDKSDVDRLVKTGMVSPKGPIHVGVTKRLQKKQEQKLRRIVSEAEAQLSRRVAEWRACEMRQEAETRSARHGEEFLSEMSVIPREDCSHGALSPSQFCPISAVAWRKDLRGSAGNVHSKHDRMNNGRLLIQRSSSAQCDGGPRQLLRTASSDVDAELNFENLKRSASMSGRVLGFPSRVTLLSNEQFSSTPKAETANCPWSPISPLSPLHAEASPPAAREERADDISNHSWWWHTSFGATTPTRKERESKSKLREVVKVATSISRQSSSDLKSFVASACENFCTSSPEPNSTRTRFHMLSRAVSIDACWGREKPCDF